MSYDQVSMRVVAEQEEAAPARTLPDDVPASSHDHSRSPTTSQPSSSSLSQAADIESVDDWGPHFLGVLDGVFASIANSTEHPASLVESAPLSKEAIIPSSRRNVLKRKKPGDVSEGGTKRRGRSGNEQRKPTSPYRGVTRHRCVHHHASSYKALPCILLNHSLSERSHTEWKTQ